MITIERIPTPQELYKILYRLVRVHCRQHDFMEWVIEKPVNPTSYQQAISETIQDFTHKYIPSCYDPSFAKQLRVFMYAYRHHRLGGVSRG